MEPARMEGRRESTDGERGRELSPELLRRLPQRDPAALEAFFDAWFDRVHGLVRRMVNEEHLAEDITQEVFLNLYRAAALLRLLHTHQTLEEHRAEVRSPKAC